MDKIQQKKIELLIQDIKLDFKYFDIAEQKLDRIIGICKQQQSIIEALVEVISISTKEQKHKIKIDECSMSPRLANLMYNFGYEYLDDVYDFWILNGDNGLLKKSSFGRKSLNELKDIFKEYKLQETKNND